MDTGFLTFHGYSWAYIWVGKNSWSQTAWKPPQNPRVYADLSYGSRAVCTLVLVNHYHILQLSWADWNTVKFTKCTIKCRTIAIQSLQLIHLPSGNLTELWKITIFNGKTHYKWPFSIANCWHNQRVIPTPSMRWSNRHLLHPFDVALSGALPPQQKAIETSEKSEVWGACEAWWELKFKFLTIQ